MTAEGGEARNHEAEREAVARALVPTGIGTWEELSSLQRSHYRQDADIAIAALDAVRRSPQGEAVAVLTRLRIELTNTSLDGSDATRIVDRALAYFTGNGPPPYEVVHGVGNVPAGRRRWTLAGYRQRVEVDAGPPIREGERIEVEEVL